MKICFIASSYPKTDTDGTARFIRSLAESIHDLGHEVHVLIPDRSDLDLTGNRIPVHTFRYTLKPSLEIMGYAQAMKSDTQLRALSYGLAPAFALMEAQALMRLHFKHQFDIIHAHWVLPNGVIAAAIADLIRRPLIISLHGSDIFLARRNMPLGGLASYAFRRCAAVTACSPELQQGAIHLGADPERLHLIAWGADPEIFLDEEQSRQELRASLGISPEDFVVLSLGRLVQKKGVIYLLRAFAQVVKNAPNSICIIAGDGPEREILESTAHSLGVSQKIRFPGAVAWKEVPRWLAASDVFVAPSIHDDNGNVDGLPTTILEAMAVGRPVVATRVAGNELVIRHGYNGLTVPEKDPLSIGHALLLLMTQPEVRKRLGKNARQLLLESLTWRKVAEKFIDIYRESLNSYAQS
jgi:glycosyltransferase involved in cell wall biosynthesis